MHGIVKLPPFLRSVKTLGMTEDEIADLEIDLANDPAIGDVIPGTGGARKFRIPLQGRGKSGGARVITYFGGDDIPVFIIDVFAKNVKTNLSKAEANELKAMLAVLADEYRASVKRKVLQLKGKRK
jgi:hypothetical protein